MNTILWHLNMQGIFIDSKNDIDLRNFYQNLEQMLGNVADVIMEDIHSDMRQRYQGQSIAVNSTDSVIDRIEQIMTVGGIGGNQ